MHPIEQLRFLARSESIGPHHLVPAAADALVGLAGDRAGLVLACRKLVEHLPQCGPLWWLCSRALIAEDLGAAMADSVAEFEHDPTPLQVSLELAGIDDRDEEPLIVECEIAGPTGALVAAGNIGGVQARDAVELGQVVWVVAGVGRVAPAQAFGKALSHVAGDDGTSTDTMHAMDFVSVAEIDRLIGPHGVRAPGAGLSQPGFTLVPELLPRS